MNQIESRMELNRLRKSWPYPEVCLALDQVLAELFLTKGEGNPDQKNLNKVCGEQHHFLTVSCALLSEEYRTCEDEFPT